MTEKNAEAKTRGSRGLFCVRCPKVETLEAAINKLQTEIADSVDVITDFNEIIVVQDKRIEVQDRRIVKLKHVLIQYNDQALAYEKSVEGRLEAIQQHYEKMPKENQSIYWTSICDDEIQDEFIGQKFFPDLQKWYQVLGVLLTQPKNDKFRCDEFGNPNRSDTCDQCPSNSECFEEEKKRRKPKELDQKTEANKK